MWRCTGIPNNMDGEFMFILNSLQFFSITPTLKLILLWSQQQVSYVEIIRKWSCYHEKTRKEKKNNVWSLRASVVLTHASEFVEPFVQTSTYKTPHFCLGYTMCSFRKHKRSIQLTQVIQTWTQLTYNSPGVNTMKQHCSHTKQNLRLNKQGRRCALWFDTMDHNNERKAGRAQQKWWKMLKEGVTAS